MKCGISGSLAALACIAAMASTAVPSFAQMHPYHRWRDDAAIRADMRAVRWDNQRIAADRAQLRADYAARNYNAVQHDRKILRMDTRARNAARSGALPHHHGW